MRFILFLTTFFLGINSLFAEDGLRPVKIAIITDLSGSGAFWGTQTVIGAERAMLELNKSDPKLELFIYDSKL